MDSRQMTRIAVEALEDKKAGDITIIDISAISVMADYFVIASASSANQTEALMDSVDEKLVKAGVKGGQTEGVKTSGWVLMDYGDLIVHIFDKENRLFYDLERIWKDGKVIDRQSL